MWKPKLQVLGSQKFWPRPYLRDGGWVKKTFVSDGDAKGYVGIVCSGWKQQNNNGRLRNLTFKKFSPQIM